MKSTNMHIPNIQYLIQARSYHPALVRAIYVPVYDLALRFQDRPPSMSVHWERPAKGVTSAIDSQVTVCEMQKNVKAGFALYYVKTG